MRNFFNWWTCCRPSIVVYRRQPYDPLGHHYDFVIRDRSDLAEWERRMARLPWQLIGFCR